MPAFASYVRQHGLSHRLTFHPGNFFVDPLPTADVLVMGRILHNWDDPVRTMLLEKAYRAISPGGALVVYDPLIDGERRRDPHGLLSSLNMLIETPGDFDFTGADCPAWMREVGFSQTRVEPLAGPQSMVVAIK